MGIRRWKIGIKQDVLLDKERSFMEKEKTIFLILLAGEVIYGSGEFDQMGQEQMIRLDRRSCIWVRRVWLDGTGEDD